MNVQNLFNQFMGMAGAVSCGISIIISLLISV